MVWKKLKDKAVRFGTRIVLNGLEAYFEKHPMPNWQKVEENISVMMADVQEQYHKAQSMIDITKRLQDKEDIANYKERYFQLQKRALPHWVKSLKETSVVGIPLSEDTEENLDKFLIDAKCFDEQSIQYVIDCLPLLNEYCDYINLPKWSTYKLLDVGSRTAAGANLMGNLYADWHYGNYQFIVDALDLDTGWVEYAKLFPYINSYRNDNIFDLQPDSYDICFCSHVIEHLEDPVAFVNRVTEVSKHFSVFYCPFNEHNPIEGHRTITEEIIDMCNPIWKKLIKSNHRWREDLEFVVFITSKNKII